MTRIELFVGLVFALLVAPGVSEAQPAGRVYRVGYLSATQMSPPLAPLIEAFRAGLREHGYVEGKNLTLEFRWAEGKRERLPALAAELIGLPVDVLVVAGNHVASVAKAATRTTPVVFAWSGDPVGAGLVASLARPGGNLTGLTWDAGPELWAKSLELVKEALPGMSRVAVLLGNADDPSSPVLLAYRAAMESGARQLQLALDVVHARRQEDFSTAFAAIERARVNALVWCVDPPLLNQPVLDFVARRRLPSAGCWRGAVAAGALMSYAPNLSDLYRRAAGYVARILKGAKPADLPVEQPTKFELVINLRTAKALGLTIPQSLLLRADELIE